VPVCDLQSTFTPDGQFDHENTPYESYREMEFTAALPAARMSYFHRHFLGVPRPERSESVSDHKGRQFERADWLMEIQDWKISPILAPNFSNLAPALVFTAEMDPLRDEGEAYAAKMNAADSRAELIRVPGVPHTFAHLDGILESGKMYNERVIAALKKRSCVSRTRKLVVAESSELHQKIDLTSNSTEHRTRRSWELLEATTRIA